MITLQMYP